ncbi:MAG: hypothetical protein ABFD49_03165 [Armatimonadota bacterium]|nr:hypothetical protein [bacterium]
MIVVRGIVVVIMLGVILSLTCLSAYSADVAGLPDVEARLKSDFHQGLYKRTYESLLSRVEDDGYMRESVKNGYPGMFPRTVGGMVSLLVETGEMEKARKLVNVVLKATKANNMTRCPHVMGRPAVPANSEMSSDYPIISRFDEIDGNFHVLMSWAMVALNSDVKQWEDETYNQVVHLTDTAIDWPYRLPEPAGVTGHSIFIGLIRNPCLEHSREGRYWDTYDILTQSFACRALSLLADVAARRGDTTHAQNWKSACADIERAINDNLTTNMEGKRIYAEMRLPDGGEGKIFEGLSWVNLGPVAAQWQGADSKLLRNTVDKLREKSVLDWNGHHLLATEWTPNGGCNQVIGKGLAWDMVYSLGECEYSRICAWLDFIQAANTDPLYAECFWTDADNKMHLNDPGNGEQSSWWCWSMAKLRKAAGLPAAP